MRRAARGRLAWLALAPLLLAAAPDRHPPALSISLNDIPEDENDLLVVPPDRFRITLTFRDAEGPLDLASLRVRSSQAIGALLAGAELASHFHTTPNGAEWEVPAGSDLARTSHYLTASISDAAGNTATQRYGFAVRDFEYGPPLGRLQVVYLNFDRHRDGQQDFRASLRELGLSSAAAPEIEQEIVERLRMDVVERVHAIYGRNPDGTPGADAVNVLFTWFDPQMPHTALCIGGEHPRTKDALGAAPLDLDNIEESQDLCAISDYGVFPSALDDLWSQDPLFIDAFGAVLPALGGTPIGEHPLDAVVLSSGLVPEQVTQEQVARYLQIAYALDAFARVIAVAAAHEVGHTLGLSAPGPAPGGLFGGTAGTARDHDVTARGEQPSENYIMNYGGSFSFAEITGRKGRPKPFFRPIHRAYLTNRLVRSERIGSLEPAPRLVSVTPDVVRFPPQRPDAPRSEQSQRLRFRGENLANAEIVDLKGEGLRPVPVLDLQVVDANTLTGRIHVLFTPPGSYDVRLTTLDGQNALLERALTIQR